MTSPITGQCFFCKAHFGEERSCPACEDIKRLFKARVRRMERETKRQIEGKIISHAEFSQPKEME
jgi:predicted nucleic acid binding AN1-type Zn finger protein